MFPVKKRSGFTLVEMSIVLVIIGLLVGGVLSGQSLIRSAELRSVISEYQRYYAAVNAFRDKYAAIPGDFNNATAFWGKDNTNCPGNSGTAMTPGTCNGNGNGMIEPAAGISATGEIFQFWKQLALAGLIEGNYTGIAGPYTPSAGWDHIPGTNSPTSRVTNAAWGTRNLANYTTGDACTMAGDYGNTFTFGGIIQGYLPTNTTVLKPEEAWNIDTKLDDGKPGTGKVIAACWSGCGTAANVQDTTGSYNLTNPSPACMLYFAKSY